MKMTDINPVILIVIFLWSLPWKGLALWKASRLNHRNWFIVLLLVNTLAIVDIYYIYKIANKYKVEVEESV